MPYPQRLLNEGEVVALDLRPHWWYFSKQIVTGVPLFVVAVLVLSASDGAWRTGAWYVLGVLAVVWVIWLGLKFAQWSFTYFVVTNSRVVYRTGVIARHGVEIPLERIANINFHQPFWERVIGCGDLEIESAGKDGQTVFEDVWHPDGVHQEIYRQIKASAQRRSALASSSDAVTAARPLSIPEQIAALADLRDRGAITSEEYEAKKAELLERM